MFESEDYKKGYEEGYKNGREWYVNDISKEIFEINTAIRVIEKYRNDGIVIDGLNEKKEVLLALQEKVKKEFKATFK